MGPHIQILVSAWGHWAREAEKNGEREKKTRRHAGELYREVGNKFAYGKTAS